MPLHVLHVQYCPSLSPLPRQAGHILVGGAELANSFRVLFGEFGGDVAEFNPSRGTTTSLEVVVSMVESLVWLLSVLLLMVRSRRKVCCLFW